MKDNGIQMFAPIPSLHYHSTVCQRAGSGGHFSGPLHAANAIIRRQAEAINAEGFKWMTINRIQYVPYDIR